MQGASSGFLSTSGSDPNAVQDLLPPTVAGPGRLRPLALSFLSLQVPPGAPLLLPEPGPGNSALRRPDGGERERASCIPTVVGSRAASWAGGGGPGLTSSGCL